MAAAFLSLAASPAFAGEVAETLGLESKWLDGSGTISLAHVRQLVDLAGRDPETAALLARAHEVLGTKTTSELMNFISVCKNAGKDIWGETSVATRRRLRTKSSAEILGQVKSNYRKEIEKGLPQLAKIESYRDLPDYVAADILVREGICFVEGQSLADSFNTFIHELSHLVGVGIRSDEESFIDQYLDREDYIEKALFSPGGEFEANLAGYRAEIRLKGSRDWLHKQLREAFDDKGNLVDKKKFKDFLLDVAGYRKLLGESYKRHLVSWYGTLIDRINAMKNAKAERDANLKLNLMPAIKRKLRDSSDRLKKELVRLKSAQTRYEARLTLEGFTITKY